MKNFAQEKDSTGKTIFNLFEEMYLNNKVFILPDRTEGSVRGAWYQCHNNKDKGLWWNRDCKLRKHERLGLHITQLEVGVRVEMGIIKPAMYSRATGEVLT